MLVLYSFLRQNNIPLNGSTTCCLSIHLSVHVWTISTLSVMNCAAVDVCPGVRVDVFACPLLHTWDWTAASCGGSLFDCRRPCQAVLSHCPSHVPPALCKGSGFPTSLPAFATSVSVLAVLAAVKGPQWGSELCSPLAAVIPGACTGTSAEGLSFPGQQSEPLPPREGGLRPVLPRGPAGAAL